MRRPWASVRPLARAVALALVLCACGLGGKASRGSGPAGAGDAVDRGAVELRRVFEESATRARNDLESARQAAEALVAGRAERSGEAAVRAREKARRALDRGAEVLRQAASNGSEAAEAWAKLIQDRMMRLEQSLDALTGSGREHADS